MIFFRLRRRTKQALCHALSPDGHFRCVLPEHANSPFELHCAPAPDGRLVKWT